ncbi:MAG: hypothetical protein DMG85_20980 [Acidobacteria bacterium]|nr:MAG: hypothetical protein DMG85_20980 [Acidobacteriota bacterium]
MADREHLHALVDSLPEGALESAQTYLKAIQIWPPKEPEYPPEVEQHRKELEAKRDKFLKGPASGTWAIGKNKSHASYGTNEHNWETDQTLEYDFHISGLGNEHGFRVQFQANGG